MSPVPVRRLRRPSRRRAVLVAAGVAGIAAVVALQLEVGGRLSARRAELAAARASLAATDAELLDGRDHLSATGPRAGAVKPAVVRTDRRVRRTSGKLRARTSERDELAVGVHAGTQALAGARTSLEAVSIDSWLQGSRIGDLDTCLRGVSRATSGRAEGGAGRAVAALRPVAEACRAAEDALAPGASPLAFPYDFADPYVLPVGDAYLAYATNGGGGNIQVIRSTDLASWEWVGDALPALPAWANPHFTWAPTVLPRADGYVLFYAVRERASNRQCITTAYAPSARGPFVDVSTGPFLCQRERGGSIDPSVFVDADGTVRLLWKSDDEVLGGHSTIWSASLDPTGRSLTSDPAPLLSADQPWEGRIIEGPSMVRVGDAYHLFYSGSFWNSDTYGIGHAVCATPVGPCSKTATGPSLQTHGTAVSSGGQEVVRDHGGRLWLAFHAWTRPNVGYPNPRTLRLERLDFANGRPVLTS